MARSALVELTKVRLRMFAREPEALFWVIVFPLALALVLGLAFRDQGSSASRVGALEGSLPASWEQALHADPALGLELYTDEAELARALQSGKVDLWLAGGDSLRGRFDPGRTESELAWRRADDVVQRVEGRPDAIGIATREQREEGSRYIDFLLPGLLGMNLMGTGMWGSGFAVVDMRQKKLLKLLMVTPMRRSAFLLAQINSRLVFLVVEVAVITLFGMLALGVPFRGSFGAFALTCLLGGACFAGIGLLVASRARTIEGVSGLMNFVMMPMWLASGVFFSYERFPEVVHPLLRLLPLTAINDALRLVMLQGEGLAACGSELAIVLGWTVVSFGVALRIFRWG